MITVDLPAPETLWQRWTTLAAALSSLGFRDVWLVDERGARHDDHGGNWARLALIDGDRAVLYGYDHEYSGTADAEPPIDLLAGAPDWLPWDQLLGEEELGYVYWYEDAAWHRVAYPEDTDDGLIGTAGSVLSEDSARETLVGFVTDWAQYEGDDADLEPAAAAVLSRPTAETLTALLGRTGKLDVVRPAGELRLPPGRPPARRRVRTLSDAEHDRLIWRAMQQATELDRPAPPHVDALDAVLAWMRDHGQTSLRAYADERSLSTLSGDDELWERIRALREAEADPRSGAWLFLRIEGGRVDRRYDSWPDWWEDNGISGPWRSDLRTEVAGRAERWKPSWTPLLEDDVAYTEI